MRGKIFVGRHAANLRILLASAHGTGRCHEEFPTTATQRYGGIAAHVAPEDVAAAHAGQPQRIVMAACAH